MVILFVLFITSSYGEREHAIRFAKQLKNSKYKPVFFISTDLESYFRKFDFKMYFSNQISDLKNIINSEKPSLILCCEYFIFPNSLKEMLLNTKITLATMDGTTFGESNENIKGSEINLFKNTNYIPKEITRIKPCPVNDIGIHSKSIQYWNIYNDLKKHDKKVVNKKYDLGINSKIVFLSIAKWSLEESENKGIKNYYNYLFNLITSSLLKSKEKITLFIIFPAKFPKNEIKKDTVTIKFINYLDYEEYEQLLLSSDLVISDNIIQTSLSKAYMAGINVLALINSIDYKNEYMSLYKFNIFPLELLFPKERNFYKAINNAEILDKNNVENKIINLLNGKLSNKEFKGIENSKNAIQILDFLT